MVVHIWDTLRATIKMMETRTCAVARDSSTEDVVVSEVVAETFRKETIQIAMVTNIITSITTGSTIRGTTTVK